MDLAQAVVNTAEPSIDIAQISVYSSSRRGHYETASQGFLNEIAKSCQVCRSCR